MVLPIASAYIGDVSPKGEEGKWMGYATAAFYGGFGVGPLLGGVMSQYAGMPFTFSFMAGLNFLAFLTVLIFLPEVAAHQNRDVGKRSSFKEIFGSKMVRGLFTYQIGGSITQSSFTAFLPILATSRGLSLTLIGIVLSSAISLMSILSALAGRIADRFNKRWLIVGGSSIITFTMFMFPQAGLFWIFLALALMLACGASMANPSISALGVKEGRKYGMGSTIGIVNMGMNIGFAVGPIIAGEVVDLGHTGYAFYFGAAILIIATLTFIGLTSHER